MRTKGRGDPCGVGVTEWRGLVYPNHSVDARIRTGAFVSPFGKMPLCTCGGGISDYRLLNRFSRYCLTRGKRELSVPAETTLRHLIWRGRGGVRVKGRRGEWEKSVMKCICNMVVTRGSGLAPLSPPLKKCPCAPAGEAEKATPQDFGTA